MTDRSCKERPIIFSAEMVRAILAGNKSVTRRIVKSQPESEGMQSYGESWKWRKGDDWFSGVTRQQLTGRCGLLLPSRCPFSVGMRLWVKETWCPRSGGMLAMDAICNPRYRADGELRPEWGFKWRSPIFMPRRISRIFLEITDVKVERVQDICKEEAIAEGFDQETCAKTFDVAAGNSEAEYCRWIENDETRESDPECANFCPVCAEKAAKKAGKKWSVCGWDNAEESDGPASCDTCDKPLFLSLSKYGIDRELRLEDDPEGNEPQYFPVSGNDARIIHTVADGIGDLQDRHLGRMAQIGFATKWEILNGKKPGCDWASNPWVWAISFRRVSP